ncbi:MAG: hypothetical protein KDA28_03820, partial [Phycisphaerales bacterium]|nr:hypothetical protein [Phycisphaerales bacterium]
VIYGDNASGTLIVRAEEAEFVQIAALVESLQQEQDDASVRPHIARVEHVPAARLRDTIRQVFEPIAQAKGEALAVQIDRTSNAVIVACSDDLFEEIQILVAELDQPAMGADGALDGAGIGQSVYVVDLEHTSPAEMRTMLEALGVTKPVPDDQPGIVGEPVTLVPLATRPALAIMANPADAKVMLSLVKSLDGEFDAGAQQVSYVALKTADAAALVRTLEALLDTSTQSSPTGAAASIDEHLSRLNFSRRTMNKEPLALDLDQPIRLLPDASTNSILVASTEANVHAMIEVIDLFDRLPIGEAVVVRIFPLEHASAVRVQAVVEDLFSQGEQLSMTPGSSRTTQPTTATGQALIGE